ncbi:MULTISPECIES: hypothetical protein [unclassified Streptomyces]|uniref:hypothetical protein n=1 Tax=unclassified Streptomyces TaxID=2593676 RepID=UPI003821B315
MSTRRNQKGRKHRTVNRTPRPVAAGAPVAGRPTVRPVSPSSAPAAAPAGGPAPVVAAVPVAPAPRSEQSPERRPEARPEPQPEPALPRTALKTLEQLRAAGGDGTTIDDLSASVGYQPATIVRHIDTLVAAELVHQRDGRWYAVSAG